MKLLFALCGGAKLEVQLHIAEVQSVGCAILASFSRNGLEHESSDLQGFASVRDTFSGILLPARRQAGHSNGDLGVLRCDCAAPSLQGRAFTL